MKFIFQSKEDAFAHVEWFVEADSFSQYALWTMWHDHPQNRESIEWQRVSKAFRFIVPESETCVSLTFAMICNRLVCFYETTSSKVDWNKVEAYLAPYWQEGQTKKQCDADHFHRCVAYCKKNSLL